MVTQILIYWIVIQALGLAALPLAARLFRSLPDRGYPFAKALGLLLVGWGGWLIAMLGLAPFGLPLLLVLIGCLAVAGWLRVRQPGSSAAEVVAVAWRQWPTLLGYEVLFLAALIFAAWMRGYQPDPWGTERPMDFAFFNAIRRGGSFPPEDPWLAGYSINYYYLGYVLMASVALLSGLAPAVTYNLSLALIFALTASGVAGVVLNLVNLSQQQEYSGDQEMVSLLPGTHSWLAWGCALFAVVGVLLAGNQAAAIQLITGSEQAVALDGRQALAALGQGLSGAETITLPYATPPINDFNAPEGLRYWERRDMVDLFNDWWPSRALWDDIESDSHVERRYTITEFPFFSFWLGDMHPHVMSLPFTLLALALALAILARPVTPVFAESWSGWIDLAMSGVILGGLYLINSWDLPTYMLIYAGALLLLYQKSEISGQKSGWLYLLRDLILTALAAFLLFLPFHLTFQSLVGGKESLIPLPLIGKLSTILGAFVHDKTNLNYFLIIFGLFLTPLLTFVLAQGQGTQETTGLGVARSQSSGGLGSRPAEIGILTIGITFALGLGVGFPLLVLLPLGVYAAWIALGVAGGTRIQLLPGPRFALWVAAMGCFICFGTELIYIRDVFEGWQPRMNTIFKFYYQTWLLWGTLAGYAFWWVLARSRRLVAFPIAALTLVLLASALIYPALTAGRLPERGTWHGLQGLTPRERSAEGKAAIEWLRRNAPANAVVLEAVGGSYNGEGYAGVSASTGIPTVIGWPGHQSQWRGGDAKLLTQLPPREEDVRIIYTTPDSDLAREILRHYKVTHIYMGDLERQTYGAEGEAKFASLGDIVFQQGSETIYQLR